MASKKNQNKEDINLSKLQLERLIDFYYEEECLWNVGSQNYHKKDTRNEALVKIKGSLEEEFEGLLITVEQILNKIHSLRGYYSRELQKVNKSKRSGAGTDDVYVSKWAYFDQLDKFLRSQITPRTSNSNLDTSVLQNEDEDDDVEVSSQCSETSNSEGRITPNPFPKKRKVSADNVRAKAVSVLESLQTKKNDEKLPEDEDDIFGKHVANELKKIKDDRIKGLIKYKIQGIIFESQFGTSQQSYPQYQNTPNNVPETSSYMTYTHL